MNLLGRNEFEGNASNGSFAFDLTGIGGKETAAPIVQEPLHGLPMLEGPVDQSVGFEVIALCLVHRDEHGR